MGPTRTWLVAVAVAALAVVAALDALLGAGSPSAARPPERDRQTSTENAVAVAEGRTPSLDGTLVYADGDCAVHAVPLPESAGPLADPRAPTGERGCRFTISPGGSFAVGEAAPRPGSDLSAVCARGRIVVGTDDGIIVGRARGCAPAWKPNGDLTGVLGGELVDIRFAPPLAAGTSPPRVLISRADVRRVFAGQPWGFAAPVIREAAWLDNARVALIVADRATGEHALAVFAGRRLVGGPLFPYPRLSRLRASPRGTYVAAQIHSPERPGLLVLDRRGDFALFQFGYARAVAWSRDEAWTAVATRDSIYVFETGERLTRFLRLDAAARDLAWP